MVKHVDKILERYMVVHGDDSWLDDRIPYSHVVGLSSILNVGYHMHVVAHTNINVISMCSHILRSFLPFSNMSLWKCWLMFR